MATGLMCRSMPSRSSPEPTVSTAARTGLDVFGWKVVGYTYTCASLDGAGPMAERPSVRIESATRIDEAPPAADAPISPIAIDDPPPCRISSAVEAGTETWVETAATK